MDLEHLDTELKSQNYYIIIKKLYECEQTNIAYEWALKKCDEGHVPLWYFVIRYYYQNNFDNARSDTVFNAWKMALKSLILSMMYISTCKEINKRFNIIDILTKNFLSVDLRRLDETKQLSEVSFLVEIDDFKQLNAAKKELQKLDKNIDFIFLNNDNSY